MKKGRFVGYDSKSKGYRIYWPEKKSITVEHNIIFNQDNIHSSEETTIIYGEAQPEGESDKVIQAPQNNAEESENKETDDQQIDNKTTEHHQNSVQFPTTELQTESDTQNNDGQQNSNQQYSCGQ